MTVYLLSLFGELSALLVVGRSHPENALRVWMCVHTWDGRGWSECSRGCGEPIARVCCVCVQWLWPLVFVLGAEVPGPCSCCRLPILLALQCLPPIRAGGPLSFTLLNVFAADRHGPACGLSYQSRAEGSCFPFCCSAFHFTVRQTGPALPAGAWWRYQKGDMEGTS